MVLYCWVCKQSQCSNQKLTLHRFPTDANERAVWFENLGLKQCPENTLKYARICSVHFEGEAFEVKPSGKIFLKKGARPLSFNQEYIPPTSRKDDSSTDSTDTASENNFLEVDKSIDGPPLKRLRSNVQTHQTEISHTLTPEMGTHSKGEYEKCIDSSSETLTASETELIHNLVTEKETDSPTNLQKRKAPDDLATSDFSTPRKVRRNLKTMKKILTGQKTKIRTLQQSVRRLRSKVTNLNSLINHLKAKSLVREDCESSLRASMSESTSELFKRMLKGPRTQKYTPALRSFALTLSFYSTKAYNYVRTTFNNSLPHPTTLSKWYQSVDGAPGWTKEALTALKLKVDAAKQKKM